MPLSGTFSTMPFADLLQWLGDSRRSGTLSVTLEFEERLIRFDEGVISAYGTDDPMARDIGRLCLERCLIKEQALVDALTAQAESHMPLADVLVARGVVDAEALDRAVRKHVEETVISLFLWPEGRFVFVEAHQVPPDLAQWMPPEYELADPLDTREILMEGMRRLDEWTRIVQILPSDEAQVVALGPADDLPILEHIAAHHEPPTLGELLAEEGDSRSHICEQLFRAFERGLVAFETGRERRPQRTGRGATTVEHLVKAADALVDEGQHEEAATLLRSAVAMDPFRADARALIQRCRQGQLAALYQAMPRQRVPVAAVPLAALRDARLFPRERKVLEHVNGRWDVAALALTTALGELETLRALRRLIHAGVVKLAAPTGSAGAAGAAGSSG
jgi:hypothetical protein